MIRCLLVMALVSLVGGASSAGGETLKALIVDGQNNHGDWPKTTMMMRAFLLDSQRFTVDVARTRFTWQGEKRLQEFPLQDGRDYTPVSEPRSDPDFRPRFSDYDVVISNFGFNAAPWPASTREAFERYVRDGGGFVVIHAANNAFGGWREYNRMIGLGGWGGRTERDGPYVYLDDSETLVRDPSPGPGGHHGAQHSYQIVIREPDHPIVRGLPRVWMHARDELYDQLRGPAENMSVLATAFADPRHGGTGRHEPMIMTIDYGQGRIFHTPMGHADYSFECVGFMTVLLRGTEWAATGQVTLDDMPADFPLPEQPRQRTFGR